MAVNIESVKGRLRLRFQAEKRGKQVTISPGYDDTKENRKKVGLLASRIELDLLSGNFDPTLEKYQPGRGVKPLTVHELFAAFILYKKNFVYHRTLEKYRVTLNLLESSGIGTKPANQLTADDVVKFVNAATGNLKEKLGLLSACWKWKRFDNSIWEQAKKAIKTRPKPIGLKYGNKVQVASFGPPDMGLPSGVSLQRNMELEGESSHGEVFDLDKGEVHETHNLEASKRNTQLINRRLGALDETHLCSETES